MARIALLANPDSGDGGADDVAGMLERHGAEVAVFSLEEGEGALELDADRIAVAGGDGSLGRAAALAAKAGVPLAVIPVGTANDFARSLDLPRDAQEAAELAARGTRTRSLDLGDASGRPFVNAASAGLSPVAAREAAGLKRAFGPFAYAAGALRAALGAQPIVCRVTCDGEERFAGPAWQVIVGVTGAFGAGAEIDADPADGVLDVATIDAGSRLALARRAYGMRAGRLERQSGVHTCAGRGIEVALERGHGFNVDGELVETTALRLSARPRALELVVA